MVFSYFLCGTPRTGSTLLCSLLSSTGRLGRPESYFREPDEAAWAQRCGLPMQGSRVRSYPDFVRAVQTAATTENGVFGARIMWGSIERLLQGRGSRPEDSDLATLEQTFGPSQFVYLRRKDVIGQAVSWWRAEQTGFWQQGDVARRPPEADLGRMQDLVRTIGHHEQSWLRWFERLGIEPHTVTYEQVVDDGRGTVEGIAARLDVDLPDNWHPASPHRKQADQVNVRWSAELRQALGR